LGRRVGRCRTRVSIIEGSIRDLISTRGCDEPMSLCWLAIATSGRRPEDLCQLSAGEHHNQACADIRTTRVVLLRSSTMADDYACCNARTCWRSHIFCGIYLSARKFVCDTRRKQKRGFRNGLGTSRQGKGTLSREKEGKRLPSTA